MAVLASSSSSSSTTATSTPPRTKSPYSCRYWYQPKAVREYLLKLCEGDLCLLHAVAHLLSSTLASDMHDSLVEGLGVGIPIPTCLWKEMGVHPEEVDKLGILMPGWKSYYHGEGGGRCREFTLLPSFVLRALRIALDHLDGEWGNTIDGETYSKRRFEMCSEQKHDRGRPRATDRAEINWRGGIAEAYRLLHLAEAISSRHHRARAIQAVRGLMSIRSDPSFRMSRSRPGFASYVPRYHQTPCGGRWYEIGSGFQGLPGSTKAALLSGTNQANHDLRSCHLAAAVALAGELNSHAQYVGDEYMIVRGLDATPEELAAGVFGARDLLKGKAAYDTIASLVDLPRDTVKTCIISLLYGASASAAVWGDGDAGAVMRVLIDHHGGDLRAARRSHAKLLPKLGNLIKFRQGLLLAMNVAMRLPNWFRKCRGRLRAMIQLGYGGKLTNAVGTSIEIPMRHDTPDSERNAAARRALSHVLTGIEQEAMQHLLYSFKQHGVIAVHLEHDGVVVVGEIPEVCIKEMRERSLLANYCELDIKEFPKASDADPLDTLVDLIRRRTESKVADGQADPRQTC